MKSQPDTAEAATSMPISSAPLLLLLLLPLQALPRETRTETAGSDPTLLMSHDSFHDMIMTTTSRAIGTAECTCVTLGIGLTMTGTEFSKSPLWPIPKAAPSGLAGLRHHGLPVSGSLLLRPEPLSRKSWWSKSALSANKTPQLQGVPVLTEVSRTTTAMSANRIARTSRPDQQTPRLGG